MIRFNDRAERRLSASNSVKFNESFGDIHVTLNDRMTSDFTH